jgi:hypothetical protein
MDDEQLAKTLQILQHTRRQVGFLNTKLRNLEEALIGINNGKTEEADILLNALVLKSPYPKIRIEKKGIPSARPASGSPREQWEKRTPTKKTSTSSKRKKIKVEESEDLSLFSN